MAKRNAGRVPQVDLLRGTAVVMMVAFHLKWSLAYFGVNVFSPFDGFWNLFQKSTAGLFISMVGVSLVLSHSPSVSGWKYLRRGARIFGYGLLITAGSLVFRPDAFVFFGVLHFIGVAIVLASPFIRYKWLNLALGVGLLSGGIWLQRLSFDFPWLVWLGLDHPVRTIDIFPILPWIGVVFLGMFAGRLMVQGGRPGMGELARRVSRPLRFLGRNSLPAYFIHLPLVFATALLISEMSDDASAGSERITARRRAAKVEDAGGRRMPSSHPERRPSPEREEEPEPTGRSPEPPQPSKKIR